MADLHSLPADLGRLSRAAADAERAGEAADAAEAHYELSRMLVDRARPEDALRHIEAARAAWLRADEPLRALRTDLGRMHVLDDLGRHEETVQVGRALGGLVAGLLVDRSVDVDTELAAYVGAAASEAVGIALGYLGRHLDALDAYEGASAGYASIDAIDNTARCRANQAVELLELGRARAAIETLTEAGAQFSSLGDAAWAAKCLGLRARAHVLLGEHLEALRLVEDSESVLAQLGNLAELQRSRLARANIYLGLNLLHEALGCIVDQIEPLRASGQLHDLADALLVNGLSLAGLGRLAEADATLAEAVTMFRDIGNRPMGGVALLGRADVAGALDRPAAVIDHLREALEALDPAVRPIEAAAVNIRLAAAVDIDEAPRYADAATGVADELDLDPLRSRALAAMGGVLVRQGLIEPAIAALSEAVDLVEAERSTLRSEVLRSSFLADRSQIYDQLVAALIADGTAASLRRAVAVADRAAAGTLFDLRTRVVSPTRVDGDQLTATQADLVALYDSMLTADRDTGAQLRAESARLESELGRLRAHGASQPDEPAGQARIAAAIDRSDTAVTADLLLYPGGGMLHGLVRRGDDFEHRLLGSCDEIDDLLEQLSSAWRHVQLLGGVHQARLIEGAVELLGELYELVYAPMRDLLDGRASLSVVSVGIATRIPFHALHDGAQFLIERCPVVQQPAMAWRATDVAASHSASW